MKKIVIVLTMTLLLSIFVVGCSTQGPNKKVPKDNKEDNLNNQEKTTVTKEEAIEQVEDLLNENGESYRDVVFDFEKNNSYIIMSIKTIKEIEESEPIVQKKWYVINKETGKIDTIITGGIGFDESLTEEKQSNAEEMVKSYLNMEKDHLVGTRLDHMKEGKYIVRAYKIENVGTENSHVISTGWYVVDMENETVESMFN